MANPFAPEAAPPQPNWLPHYPSSRYVEKGLAPESKNMSYEDVTALAKARKLAETSGVLTPELGQHMLPMAMVEGRSGNYGINANQLFANPKTIERFKKMGFDVQDEEELMKTRSYDPRRESTYTTNTGFMNWLPLPQQKNTDDRSLIKQGMNQISTKPPDILIKKDKRGDRFLHIDSEDSPDRSARMMAALLAEKASQAKSSEEAVRLWNGKSVVKDDLGRTMADPDQYVRKVQEAGRMLHHPANQRLREHYFRFYK